MCAAELQVIYPQIRWPNRNRHAARPTIVASLITAAAATSSSAPLPTRRARRRRHPRPPRHHPARVGRSAGRTWRCAGPVDPTARPAASCRPPPTAARPPQGRRPVPKRHNVSCSPHLYKPGQSPGPGRQAAGKMQQPAHSLKRMEDIGAASGDTAREWGGGGGRESNRRPAPGSGSRTAASSRWRASRLRGPASGGPGGVSWRVCARWESGG